MSSKKKLVGNFLSLSIVQGMNYILPLLTLPYLVRVLGPEKYGMTAFALAFTQLFVIFTDYGFNLSATKEISINREDDVKVSRIFSSVISIKIIFLIISFFIVLFTIIFIPKFEIDKTLYLLTFTLVIGNALFPIWFFQGVEKMKFITFLNIVSRSFYAVSIFIFIKNESDYLLVNFLNGLSTIIISVVSLIILYLNFDIRYKVPSINELINQIREGWYIFLSTMGMSLYTVSNTLFLGIFTNNTIVGYYAGAEKIINAFTGLINPLSQTIFPHINKLANKSKQRAIQFISGIFKIVAIGTLLCSVLIFFLAEYIVLIILGDGYQNSVIILKILSILPLLIGMSNILGIQTMVTFGYNRAFSKILIFASVINVFITILLVPSLHHIGTAFSVLFSEMLVTILMYYYLSNRGIKILEGKYYHV